MGEIERLRARAALELRRRRAQAAARSTSGWAEWLEAYFPDLAQTEPSDRHRRLWDWFAALRLEEATAPKVEVWPRGGGKSTTAELGVAFLGNKLTRRFALYVSGTQVQANRHVQAIGKDFEAQGIGRGTNRYGNSLGWRMDMLRTANGFNVLAFGLDAAGRGVKLDEFRPDLIIFDDVDDRHDSERTVEKKITTITDSILPMGSPGLAVLVIQNLVHANSIVARLVDGRADFLHGRTVFQDPAIEGLEIAGEIHEDGTRSYQIIAGRATWAGQDLETATFQINTWGRSAFLREAQHDLTEAEGGLWDRRRDIDPFRMVKPPGDLWRIGVAIDPNATGTADAAGIMVGGVLTIPGDPDRGRPDQKHGYLLEDCTVDGGPRAWARAAVDAYFRWGADVMVAEQNNGGDMVAITIGTVAREGPESMGRGRQSPRVVLVHASRGKVTRATPVQKLCEDGLIHHCGVFVELERELCTWREGEPSPNRLDAYVWLWSSLLLKPKKRVELVTGRTRSINA